jgi:hypothetical protein
MMANGDDDQRTLAERMHDVWNAFKAIGTLGGGGRFAEAMGALTPPGTGLEAGLDPTRQVVGPRSTLAMERDLGLAPRPAVPRTFPNLGEVQQGVRALQAGAGQVARGGTFGQAEQNVGALVPRILAAAPRVGVATPVAPKVDDIGVGKTDLTSPVNAVQAPQAAPPRTPPLDVPPGLRASYLEDKGYPTTTASKQMFPMAGIPMKPQAGQLNDLLAAAAIRGAKRELGEDVPDVIPHVGTAPPPGVTYDYQPADRYTHPVGPGIHVRGTPFKGPGAPDVDPREVQGTPAYYAQMAKFRPNPMDPMAVESLIGRGGGTPAVEKALANYYGPAAAGGAGFRGGVPTPAGPAAWAIPTLRSGHIEGNTLVPAREGLAVGYNLAQQQDMARRGISPGVSQPGFEWTPENTAEFGKSMAEQTKLNLAARQQALAERKTEAEIKAMEEEKPAKAALLKAKALGAEEESREIEERRKPENVAEAKLLKMLQAKQGTNFLNTPAGIKLQEEAGWPVEPNLKIGVKLPKGQAIEDLTPEQAHRMKIPMTDILASTLGPQAAEDYKKLLRGIPPGETWGQMLGRRTPDYYPTKEAAIAAAQAKASPEARAYIKELLAHASELQ